MVVFLLFQTFQDEGISNYIVVYLRLLTSAQLQKKADFFENFIEGGRTVQEFCSQVKFISNFNDLSRARKSKLFWLVRSSSTWTKWSTIQGVIVQVISKSDERDTDLKLWIFLNITLRHLLNITNKDRKYKSQVTNKQTTLAYRKLSFDNRITGYNRPISIY